MVTVSEALSIIKSNIPQQKMEIVDLHGSSGRVLFEDISATHEYPSCDNSLMDGFAVNWYNVQNVSPTKPVRLRIAGESRAGAPYNGKIENGEAVRIFTGAMLPEGADTIIPIEDCQLSENLVSTFKANNINQFVCFRGIEIPMGETIAEKGTVLTAPLVGLLASVGIENIPVFQKPKVSVIVTGSELIALYSPVEKYQVRDSNRIMLSAAVENSGGEVTNSHRVKDSVENIYQVIKKSEDGNQIIILSGGTSTGTFDLTKRAVNESGFKILFEAVKQQPGKSLLCAQKKGVFLFGLPGQPQAAHLCFSHYIFPVIKKLSGKKFGWKKIWGRLNHDLFNEKNLTRFKPVQIKQVEKDFPDIIEILKKKLKLAEQIMYCDGYIVLEYGDLLKNRALANVFLFPDKQVF